jgi:hypothetical protein
MDFGNKSGLYFRLLTSTVNGSVSVNKRGIIKIPIEINIADVTGETQSEQDVRTVFPPQMWNNKLVPLLVYVDPVKFEAFMKK